MFKRKTKMTDSEFIARMRRVLTRDFHKSEEEILAVTGKKLVSYWYLATTTQSAERMWRLRKEIEKGMPFTIKEIDKKYICLEAR